MKSVFKRILLVCMSALLLVVLCSCDSGVISTQLNLDDSFAGTRVISFEVKNSEVKGLVSTITTIFSKESAAESVAKKLQEKCPEQLDMTYTMDGKDAECTFVLSFANKEEYEKKAGELLGRKAQVVFEGESADIFVSGVTLTEDFTSGDLMQWVVEVIKEENPTYAEKFSFDETNGSTVVRFRDGELPTSSMINIAPAFTPLEKVIINTTRYGDNDYFRTVEIRISEENLKRIGKDRLTESFLQPLTEDILDISTAGWKDGAYVISMVQGSFDDLVRFTQAVFEGSVITYDASGEKSAFSESGELTENIVFNGFVCNEDRSANISLVYQTNDETLFKETGDGVLAADGKSIRLNEDNCLSRKISVVSETRYVLESIGIKTDVSAGNRVTASVILDYPTLSSRSASELAVAYFENEYADSSIKVDVRAAGVAESTEAQNAAVTADTEAKKYCVVFSASGTPDEVSEVLKNTFGENNYISFVKNGAFQLYLTYDVCQSVDVSNIAELAQYGGKVRYTFDGDYTKVQNVVWKDSYGNEFTKDLNNGQAADETFTVEDDNMNSTPFMITYQFRKLNVVFIVGAGVVGILAICLLMLISSFFNKKLRAKRKKKKENVAVEAVKTVALAALPEEKRGQLSELPKELTQRPMVVIEPRNDDGLDEDDDDPEGVQLFATTLRLLAVTIAVLFFFPFCNVQRASLVGGTESLSGWTLFRGKNLFGVDTEPQRFAIILLIIPVVTLLLLMCRRKLPRVVIPVYVTASSLFAVFSITKLQDMISSMIDALKNSVNGYIAEPVYQMGYKYSIVIYMLLGIGGILLLFSDVSYVLGQKRKKEE